MKGGKLKYSVFILIVVGLWACTEPPTPMLRQADRQLIDSLYNLHYDSIKVELDSACVTLKEQTIKPAIDSILKRRLVEKAKLMNRYEEQEK